MSEYAHLSVWQKLSEIASELPALPKDSTVQRTNGRSYNAVSKNKVFEAVKSLEHKYGIFSFAVQREDRPFDFERSFYSDGAFQGKYLYHGERIKTTYRFVNVDKPEEFAEITSFGTGIDLQDKASIKAMTASDKYALLLMYKIQTEDSSEDPDVTSEPPDGCVQYETNTVAANSKRFPVPPDFPKNGEYKAAESVSASGDKGNTIPSSADTVSALADGDSGNGSVSALRTTEGGSTPKETESHEENSVDPWANCKKPETADEARKVVFPKAFGKGFVGKTMQEVLETQPGTLIWYTENTRYINGKTNEKYPQILAACRLLADEARSRLAHTK